MPPVKKKARGEEPNDSTVDDPSSGFIRFDIHDVSSKAPFIIFSPEIEVMGIPWKIMVKKQKKAKPPHLGVYLCHRESDSGIWSIDVSARISLINMCGKPNLIYDFNPTFCNEFPAWGKREFLTWNELIDDEKGFIKEDKITLEVRFTLSNIVGIRLNSSIEFTDPNDPRHDVAFVIGGEKVYSNKSILAVHSPVFNAMFYGNFAERDKKEIELKDVDRMNFITMLNLIYPSSKKITDTNAESLLELADRFQIKTVFDQVEEFLVNSSKLSIPYKLKLSDDYRLVKLDDHCLATFKTVKEIMDLKTDDFFKALSDKAKVALLAKAMKLN